MGKIVIPHSWSLNVGDMAVLCATIDMLHQVAPGAGITALVSHPDFTLEKFPHLEARVERWLWPTPGGPALSMAWYPFIYVSHFISVMAYRLAKAKVFLFNKGFEAPLSSLFECDVLLSQGGDFISPRYVFITTFTEYIMAKMLGKKVVICAQTIGPFEGLLNGRLAAAVLNLADLIILREHESERLLKNAGVRPDKIHVTADIVFTFRPPKSRPARARRVMICAERFASASQRRSYAKRLKELTGRITSELDCEVVFFPANKTDIGIQREIASGMENVRVMDDVRTPMEVALLVSEADFLISSRMHPIILGAISSTPFFALEDSFKFQAVLGSLCSGCWMKLDEFERDGSIETVLEKIRERETLRRDISERLPALREKAGKTALILNRKFGEWGLLTGPDL